MKREPLFRRYLRFWSADPRRDVDEELSFHLEMRRREFESTGMPVGEAEEAARKRFGDVNLVQSEVERLAVARSTRRRRTERLEAVRYDIAFAIRSLRAKPIFAVAVALTLAIGIGANLAMFAVVDAVVLRPLSLQEPERIVRLVDDLVGAKAHDVGMSVPELGDLSARTDLFDDVSPAFPVSAALGGGDHVERVEFLGTGANYFDLLRAKAAIGRVYTRADWRPGFIGTVVISDALWRRQFGADSSIIGKTIRLDEDPYTVVGVMPPDFRHPARTLSGDVDIWAGAGFVADPFPSPPVRGIRFIPGAIARLKRGVTLREAQTSLKVVASRLANAYPNDYPKALGWSLRVEPVQEALTSSAKPTLLVLLAAVTALLVLVCVNVATLTLARSSVRVREIALRQVLGASRGRIARQLLLESIFLATIGGIAAIGALRFGIRLLVAMIPPVLPRLNEIQVDWRIMIGALLISLIVGVLVGLAPTTLAAAVDTNQALKDGGRTGAAANVRHNRWRSVLVVTEVALSALLLVSAGLLVRSFRVMMREDPGFKVPGIMTGRVWVPVPNNPAANKYLTREAQVELAERLLDGLQHLPGVDRAALGSSSDLPLSNGESNPQSFSLPDELLTQRNDHAAQFGIVSADYFATLGIPVEDGRAFTVHDTRFAPKVAIVNREFARRFGLDRGVIGRRLRVGQSSDFTIVGLVADVHDVGLDVPAEPRVYLSVLQRPTIALSILVHGRNGVVPTADALVRTVHDVDPELPVFGMRTMKDLLSASMASRRFALALMSGFAAAAALLAALGIYGAMALFVAQRRQDFGVRRALGATAMNIVAIAVGPGLALCVIGATIGLTAGFAATRAMSSLLFGVSAHDPTTFVAVPALLVVTAVVACLGPARRAIRIDPTTALRD